MLIWSLKLKAAEEKNISIMWYDIYVFVNCNWVATRWQQYSTYLQTKNTQNDTKQTILRTTQKFTYIYVWERERERECVCVCVQGRLREKIRNYRETIVTILFYAVFL
jgi:hypothetical protein